jgi:threonine synthase
MNYYSLHRKSPNTTFKNAVIEGLAKDRGIYFQ